MATPGYEYTVKVFIAGDWYVNDHEHLRQAILHGVNEDTDYDERVDVVIVGERWTGD